jgi:Ca2+-binding RTX toxin-like protein
VYDTEVTMRKCVLCGLLFSLIAVRSAAAEREGRLLRFPAIHDDQIVFTYAGNLYSVASKGGVARKLTSHEGFEMFARFSPDCKTIAFTGQYDGNIDGGGGVNTLDYSPFDLNVYVNLQTGKATAVAGIANIQNVTGGPLTNLLVGNGGNVLIGGSGRNVLIAGGSAGTLIGGGAEDILIGGTTAYDTNDTALQQIMTEWARTDEDYYRRVANLTQGNGVPLLDATTVKSNGGGNTMLGNGPLDLYFGNSSLDSTDWVGDQTIERFIAV